jgi:hexosaminidase
MSFRHTAPLAAMCAALSLAACGGGAATATRPSPAPAPAPTPGPATAPVRAPLAHAVIPLPGSISLADSGTFVVDSTTAVVVAPGAGAEVARVAQHVLELLGRPAGAAARRLVAADTIPARSIYLRLGDDAALGDEGYRLEVTPLLVTITANRPAGLFYGVQTMRQLMPPSIEHPAALNRGLRIPAGVVSDAPRFAWRGSMIDVARHFLPVEELRRHVDRMALYKLNRLHLHLSDDQGWRIEIKSWPALTAVGGSTQVGGGAGGFYTQEQFADLARYAAERYVTIVPEIDMPGHTNAALASYAALNCGGVAPPLYTGTRVGFSALCVTSDSTYRFVSDVVREIAALTPSPWFHIGGDEVEKLTHEQYRAFIERVQGIVHSHGRRMIGWGEIAVAALEPGTVVQHWKPDSSALHAARGGRVILSPNKRAYLDQKYDASTILGLRWAGLIEVRDSYDWDPAAQIEGVPERAVFGVEAPLWAETLVKSEDWEFMAFPRLVAIAEVGWSSAPRDFESFRQRLGAHGPRLAALGVNFYRSPQVPWWDGRPEAPRPESPIP